MLPVTTQRDLFAEAVESLKKVGKSNFEFYFTDEKGNDLGTHSIDLSRYWRTCQNLSEVEHRLINLVNGEVLDIGCATGYYFSCFSKHANKVLGVESSEIISQLGREYFQADILTGDIFKLQIEEKFHTITFLQNNLGVCQQPEDLHFLLQKCYDLLHPEGKVLIHSKIYDRTKSGTYYNKVWMQPILDGEVGEGFWWITFDQNYILEIATDIGFKGKIEFEDMKSEELIISLQKS